MDWVTKGTITVQVNFTTYYNSQPIGIECRHFRPQDSDIVVIYRSFTDPIHVPAYAASNMPDLQKDLIKAARSLREAYIQEKADNGCCEAVIISLQAASRYAVCFQSARCFIRILTESLAVS